MTGAVAQHWCLPWPTRRHSPADSAAAPRQFPVVGYLLTGVTTGARPGSVEVLGGRLTLRLSTAVS
jgi:hypothetical protein